MNTTSKPKWVNLIAKISLFIIFIIIQQRLLDMVNTVPDKWVSTWLIGAVLCALFVILFGAWIAETVINWNRK